MGQLLFADCKELKTLACGSSIGMASFKDIEALESVTLTDTVETLEEQAFSGCKALTEVKVPEGVTGIGSRAFYGCEAMRKLYLPGTLETIGSECFYGATSLKTVSYCGTADQWKKVTKEEGWNKNLPGTLARITNYDPQK